MNLAQRARATQLVLDRYRNRPFDWAGANCIRLAHDQALAMGHAVPDVPGFRSAIGARRALARQGADTVSGLLDMWFARWPAPAFARLGDLVCGPAAPEHGLEAIGIADGQGNIFGWHQQTEFMRLETIKFALADLTGAWRL